MTQSGRFSKQIVDLTLVVNRKKHLFSVIQGAAIRVAITQRTYALTLKIDKNKA